MGNKEADENKSVNGESKAAEHFDVSDCEMIELFDDDGEEMTLQLLDTIAMVGKTYFVLTPYDPDEPESDEPIESEVYIMTLKSDGDTETLELVEDDDETARVFEEFKNYADEEYEFLDE